MGVLSLLLVAAAAATWVVAGPFAALGVLVLAFLASTRWHGFR